MSVPDEFDLEKLWRDIPEPENLPEPQALRPADPPLVEPPEESGERLTLTHEGVTYAVMTPERLRAAGVPGAVVRAALTARARTAARQVLDAHVAAARAAFVTALPGQEMVYLAKEAEAREWAAATAPDLADYPLLSAEVGVTAETADQLAQVWLNMAALWRSAAARLEARRLGVSAALDAARSPEEVEAALRALT
ncbi:hypothetical protein [Neomegalonema sp.]|uniref:hypothetical protein n=1 Tax=Neomegalonema sp. TaxID=2039713 RepID=UPI00262D688C|nr:hypothetical protein [Neomegalonema sp.]MDD2868439.1 hypothetical protein [Neomegalonema sp.]